MCDLNVKKTLGCALDLKEKQRMKKTPLWAIVATLTLLGSTANAAPFLLTVDSSQSTIALTIAAIGGAATGAVNTTVSGTIAGDLLALPIGPNFQPDALTIQTTGILGATQIGLTNGSLSVSLGFLGSIEAETFGVGATLDSQGALPPSTPGIPTSLYDPNGTVLTLNIGHITYKGAGAVGGLLGSGTFDFVADPTSVVVPSAPDTVGITIAQNAGPKGVTLIIPLNVTTTVVTDPVDVTANVTGFIVATGFMVPEPGTVMLLAIGVIGLVPVIRKRFAKSA